MEEHVEEITLPSPNQSSLPDGKSFPAAFVPKKSDKNSLEDLLELIQKHRECIKEQVVTRGALLFRGWQVNDGKDFAAVVDALGYEKMLYEQRGAPRKHVAGSVYTANETPVDQAIGFHNEMSYLPLYPDVIMFYCEKPSPQGQGGETALLHGKVVYDRLVKELPDFVQKLEQYKMELYSPPTTDWRIFFNTSDKTVAQSRAKAVQAHIEWEADDSATIYRGPLAPSLKHPITGKTVWFNNIGLVAEFMVKCYLRLGDGSPVSEEEIQACVSVYKREQIVVQWERGDFVIADNLSVMHSRLPGQPPRVVLVAFGKYSS